MAETVALGMANVEKYSAPAQLSHRQVKIDSIEMPSLGASVARNFEKLNGKRLVSTGIGRGFSKKMRAQMRVLWYSPLEPETFS